MLQAGIEERQILIPNWSIINEMSTTCETRILILADHATATRWSETLRDPGTEVWIGRDTVPADQKPDVVLTADPQADLERLGDCGVVKVGLDEPADVQLPESCTARELQLACRLLAQIVRLRRQQRLAAETQKQLSIAALTDPLTGLPNRRAWETALADRLALAAPAHRLCLAILDLDHFKQVNDTYGHAVGDGVLKNTGHAICEGLRQDDFVARLGGDEFGLLLWVPNASVGAAVVERVRARVAAYPDQNSAAKVTASAGFGLTSSDIRNTTGDVLFSAADAALCEAKRDGRDRTVGRRQ